MHTWLDRSMNDVLPYTCALNSLVGILITSTKLKGSSVVG